ncbi:prenyltransferase/squalene oxidase repeat-containing protein [Enterococcus pingfangensis]|uniref:prenyltransferase/squalene oxidase repeat-containing protein n=1 Tax=Enterococcus pingfangensis TaxID=2559924 RepID=UPI0010F7486B|nr:prenyltransferase/squalene oxidase repeat-containing protein [Enterococcus pingfangensis]
MIQQTEAAETTEPTKKVQELIQAIEKLSSATVTYQEKGQVEALIETYNTFSETEKQQVTNSSVLSQMIQQINQQEQVQPQVRQKSEKTKITMTVERLVLGQGFIVEPLELEVDPSWNYAQVFDYVLKNEAYTYEFTGNLDGGFYLAGIDNADTGKLAIPDSVKQLGDQLGTPVAQLTVEDNFERPALAEFSYTSTSGWKYSVNHSFPGVGMSSRIPQTGDVCRVQFTLLGFGSDLGASFGGGSKITVANKDELIRKIGEINQDKETWLNKYGETAEAAYNQGMKILKTLDSSQSQVDQILKQLKEIEPEIVPEVENVIKKIDALGEITLEKEKQIEEARNSYDALTLEQKAQVGQTKLAILLAAEAKYKELVEANQVSTIISYINSIPPLNSLSLSHQIDVQNIRAQYDQLAELLKPRITNYQKLLDSEQRLSELEAAENSELVEIQKVIELIDNLPNPVTEEAKSAIETAQKAYDELTDLQKDKVTNYQKLREAQEQFANLSIMNKTNFAINQASAYLAKKYSGEWTAFAMARIPNSITVEQKMNEYKKIAAKVEAANGNFSSWTDAARYGIGIESLGGNASDVRGHNIPQAMIDHIDSIKKRTLNNSIYTLITLDMREYGLKEEEAIQEELVDDLLSKQTPDGGWNLNGTVTGAGDVDLTGMALTALSAHREREDVQTAIRKAILMLNNNLTKEGDFFIESWFAAEGNSNSNSQALMGLALNGVDISQYSLEEGQTNPINGLISYQKTSGGFVWQKSEPYEDTMATEQALYALVQVQLSHDGKGSSYDFEKNPISPLPAEDFAADAEQVNQLIRGLPDPENIRYQDNTSVAEAQTAYKKLAQDAQKLVEQALIEKLADCQERISLDKTSANKVKTVISQLLQKVSEATLDQRTAIEEVYSHYQTLTEQQKEYLDPTSTNKFLGIYQDLQVLIKDAETLTELISEIKQLPEPGKVELADQKAINNCRKLYDSLSEKGKKQLSSELLIKLQNCENKLAELVMIKELIVRIESLPETITLTDKTEIEAVQSIYQSLTEEQQKLVTNLSKFKQAQAQLKKLLLLDQVDQSIEKAVSTVEGSFYGEWQAFALAHLPNNLTDEQKMNAYRKIADAVEKADGNFSSWTDAARYGIGVESLGKNASDVRGHNIPQAMINHIDSVKKRTLNNAIYALITLDMRDYGLKEETATQEELVDYLLSKQTISGGWNLSGSTTGAADIDLTGMALTALSAHRERKDVQEATRKAVILLIDTLTEDGDFFIESWFASEGNLNSNAQALMGLLLNDVDIFSEDFLSNEKTHPVAGLLSYQLPNGSFMWQKSEPEEDSMATEQALYALSQLRLTLSDKGSSYNFEENPVSPLPKEAFESVETQIQSLPKIEQISLTDEKQVQTVRDAYDALSKEDQARVKKELVDKLIAAEKRINLLWSESEAAKEQSKAMLKATKNYITNLFSSNNPQFGNEWMIMGIAREDISSLNQTYNKIYYANIVEYIKQKNGQLHGGKYTEFSRLALAVTAIGKDARNVGGYDLFDYLSDFDRTIYQGVNGAMFALIAVDAKKEYQFKQPEGIANYTTRKKLIDHILENQQSFGGWNLANDEDQSMAIDLTGMALQALAPYYNDSNYPKVHAAVDKAINFLSSKQNNYGAFGEKKSQNVEEVAQVITGLSALGIDPGTDARFKKKGKSLIQGLAQFHIANSGFMHVLPGGTSNGGGVGGELDPMASEQGFYALVAYKRFLDQKHRLYDMNDLELNSEEPDVEPTIPKQPNDDGTDPVADQQNNKDSGKKISSNTTTGIGDLQSSGETKYTQLYGTSSDATPLFANQNPISKKSIKNQASPESNTKASKKKASEDWDFTGENYEAASDAKSAKKKKSKTTRTAVVVTLGTAATAGLSGGLWWFFKRKV